MRRYQLHFILAIIVVLSLACACLMLGYIPARASMLYGPPARVLSISDRIEYSTRLLSHGDLLVKPLIPNGIDQPFHVEQGESIRSIATRLEESYIIADAQAFYDYVVYTGLDLTIQSGDYILNPALSIIDITRELQDSTPEDINFVILSGWRMEEIAASLPTSGLDISPEAFIAAAQNPPHVLALPSSATMEGFFFQTPTSCRVPPPWTNSLILSHATLPCISQMTCAQVLPRKVWTHIKPSRSHPLWNANPFTMRSWR